MPPKKRRPPSKRDKEVWRKFGVGNADNSPHSYDTIDVYNEPDAHMEFLPKIPASIQLLARSHGKPLMHNWYDSLSGEKPSTFEEWEEGLHKPPPESELIVVTGDQLSEEHQISSESEYDVRQPVKIDWSKISEADLDGGFTPFSLFMSAEFDAAELDITLSGLIDVEKKTPKDWDVEMQQNGADYFEIEQQTNWGARLRYYKLKYIDLFVVLYLRGNPKTKLTNYFYLEVGR